MRQVDYNEQININAADGQNYLGIFGYTENTSIVICIPMKSCIVCPLSSVSGTSLLIVGSVGGVGI